MYAPFSLYPTTPAQKLQQKFFAQFTDARQRLLLGEKLSQKIYLIFVTDVGENVPSCRVGVE